MLIIISTFDLPPTKAHTLNHSVTWEIGYTKAFGKTESFLYLSGRKFKQASFSSEINPILEYCLAHFCTDFFVFMPQIKKNRIDLYLENELYITRLIA